METGSRLFSGYRFPLRSLAKLHVEHVPALLASSVLHRDRVLVCNPRDAIPVHLPMAGRGAVGRQQLRFRPSCRVAIDDVILSPDDGRNTSRTTMPAATRTRNLLIALLRSRGPEGRLMTRRIWALGGRPDMKRFRGRS